MTSLLSNLLCCSALFLAPGCAFVPSRSFTRGSQTALYDTSSSNNVNRARVEQIFEESMGNDWKLFRAQLVAQEQAERSEEGDSSLSSVYGDDLNNKDPRRAEEFCDTVVSVIFPPSTTNMATSDGSMPQDPFVSPDELRIHIQPKIRVNKHRWAHPIDHIEIGCILIANEELQGVFQQTVVLVVDHDEETGTTGVIINR
jgi:putative transcriptional regulator